MSTQTHLPTASRPIRSRPDPEISIVIVCSSGIDALDRFLDTLVPQAARLGAEVVVAHSGEAAGYQKRFPGIRLLALPKGSGSAQLRAGGFATSTGDVVAIIETRQDPPPSDWLDHLVERKRLAYRDSNR